MILNYYIIFIYFSLFREGLKLKRLNHDNKYYEIVIKLEKLSIKHHHPKLYDLFLI